MQQLTILPHPLGSSVSTIRVALRKCVFRGRRRLGALSTKNRDFVLDLDNGFLVEDGGSPTSVGFFVHTMAVYITTPRHPACSLQYSIISLIKNPFSKPHLAVILHPYSICSSDSSNHLHK